jgi:hypothetical protein
VKCTYCGKPCDDTKHDHYGEWKLGRTILVCDECDEFFTYEDGPWSEIN